MRLETRGEFCHIGQYFCHVTAKAARLAGSRVLSHFRASPRCDKTPLARAMFTLHRPSSGRHMMATGGIVVWPSRRGRVGVEKARRRTPRTAANGFCHEFCHRDARTRSAGRSGGFCHTRFLRHGFRNIQNRDVLPEMHHPENIHNLTENSDTSSNSQRSKSHAEHLRKNTNQFPGTPENTLGGLGGSWRICLDGEPPLGYTRIGCTARN
jgi:hypothetical protein